MTREEAIERLKQNKAATEYYAGQSRITAEIENSLKDSEAFDMAIEALSADTIPIEKYHELQHQFVMLGATFADLTEVVRCKDCRRLEVINTENTYAICHEHDIIFEPFEDSTKTNFCSWGERREK